MRLIYIFLFVTSINLYADTSILSNIANAINPTNSLINYSSTAVNQALNASSPTSPAYANSINTNLNSSLAELLKTNSLNKSNYLDALDNSFLNGFKSQALSQLGNSDQSLSSLISSSKNMDELSQALSGTNLGDISESLNEALKSLKASFACMCATELSQAFDDFQKHITDDNLTPIYANLKSLAAVIKNNLQVLQSKSPVILKSNEAYVAKIVEARAYLNSLKKELYLLEKE